MKHCGFHDNMFLQDMYSIPVLSVNKDSTYVNIRVPGHYILFHIILLPKGPVGRSSGRTATLRLIVQPYVVLAAQIH
jgi:hypothetical protein